MKMTHKTMHAKLMIIVTLLGSLIGPVLAEEEGMTAEEKKQLGDALVNPSQEDIWTQIGVYGLFVGIEGDTQLNGVTSDVDVSFDDIWDNFDIGGMGFVEHRRERWSFIGDVAYLKLEADRTVASRPALSVTLDAELQQLVLEGFIGYRLLTQELQDARLGIDLLGGARYNDIEIELDSRATLLGLTTSASRDGSVDTVDGVIAVRVEYSHNNGWGLTGWADIGEGSDSSSYQLFGGVNYTFKNNMRFHAGYRLINFDYERNSFEYDLDYTGPQIGLAYKF
ncbi:MAG: outer membrane protein [Planctomycetota bacterium]|jgi:opacity protein-like surface antigen